MNSTHSTTKEHFVRMEESDKLPLKRVELSLTKFNEVAIPHHLDLLRQHKANIIKHSAAGAYTRVRAEQTHARRVAARLRVLLAELEALRTRVRAADLPAFDRRTERSRELTLRAIVDYLGAIESGCRELVCPGRPGTHAAAESSPAVAAEQKAGAGEEAGAAPAASADGAGPAGDGDDAPPLQLQVDEQELAAASREEVLRGWVALQGEVRALHDAWQHVQAAALQQREPAARVAAAADEAAGQAEAARAHLAAAERLRGGAWVCAGAAAGALAGGPLGLAAGAKAGAAAALAGSLLGGLAVRLLGRRRRAHAD